MIAAGALIVEVGEIDTLEAGAHSTTNKCPFVPRKSAAAIEWRLLQPSRLQAHEQSIRLTCVQTSMMMAAVVIAIAIAIEGPSFLVLTLAVVVATVAEAGSVVLDAVVVSLVWSSHRCYCCCCCCSGATQQARLLEASHPGAFG